MFCQLGNIIFDKAKTPNSINENQDFTYAEHALINQKNRLQPTGQGLRQMTLNLYLNINFSKVKEDIETIRTAATDYEVLPLLWGNGKLEGNFVIVNLTIDTKETNDEGAMYAASLVVSLKEFMSNPVQQQQQKADKQAFATGTKKSITAKKAPGATTPGTPAAPTTKPTGTCNTTIAGARSRLLAVNNAAAIQHSVFQGFNQDVNNSRQFAAKLAQLASEARRIANGLIVNNYECIRLECLAETSAVRLHAGALADAAIKPPLGVVTWWSDVQAKFSSFSGAVTDFAAVTRNITAAAITRR